MFASVIIPTRTSAHLLHYTLLSLNLQYAPFDEFEVIVVDNASTDGVRERVAAFPAHYPLRCTRLPRPVSMQQAFNHGVAKARGEIIILLQDHMLVSREFIGCHVQAHCRTERLALLGGPCKRIYSVYFPSFLDRQQWECQRWLEQFPQIKRPHTTTKVIPLLTEAQIASGMLFAIGLPSIQRGERRSGSSKRGEAVLPAALSSEHLSLPREAIAEVGLFHRPRTSLATAEKDLGRRLYRAGYRFEVADKLTLLYQEHPLLPPVDREQRRRT